MSQRENSSNRFDRRKFLKYLGEGDIDWPAVREAFAAIHYTGSATVELPAGDEAYLRDISRRVDRLLLGTS
jgi:sugar phosphate isomerase/epimerase